VKLHNVTSVTNRDTNQSFDNYWDNSTRGYETQAITYSPNYRELRGTADYRIESRVRAAVYDESNVTELRLAEGHQPIVADEDEDDDMAAINLVLIDGDLQAVDSDAQSVIPERVTESTTITVENDSNTGPITLELPTGLREDNWNTSQKDSILHQPYENGSVESVTFDQDENTATATLNGSMEYNLTLHKVDVGSGATDPEPTYLRNRSFDDSTLELSFEVRDKFNDRVEESVYWVFNGTPEDAIKQNVTDGKETVTLDGVSNEDNDELTFDSDERCGVALVDPEATTPEPYQEINMTGRC